MEQSVVIKLPLTVDICELLPETIYAAVEEQFHTQLWQELSKTTSVKQIARRLRFSAKQLYRWKEGETLYPLSSLNELCALIGTRPVISYVRTNKSRDRLYEPRIEQELTPELVEFFGHLLFDGGIDGDYRVHYTTDNTQMAHRFHQLVGRYFGRTKTTTKASGLATVQYFPAILGKLLERNFELPKGSKVKSDIRLPASIKAKLTDQRLIIPFIAAAYLCDGDHTPDRMRLGLASRSLERSSGLLLDFRDLLLRLKFRSSRIKGSTVYETKDGKHRNWILDLANSLERKRFLKMVQDYCSASIS
jgi:hypothetical protein